MEQQKGKTHIPSWRRSLKERTQIITKERSSEKWRVCRTSRRGNLTPFRESIPQTGIQRTDRGNAHAARTFELLITGPSTLDEGVEFIWRGTLVRELVGNGTRPFSRIGRPLLERENPNAEHSKRGFCARDGCRVEQIACGG